MFHIRNKIIKSLTYRCSEWSLMLAEITEKEIPRHYSMSYNLRFADFWLRISCPFCDVKNVDLSYEPADLRFAWPIVASCFDAHFILWTGRTFGLLKLIWKRSRGYFDWALTLLRWFISSKSHHMQMYTINNLNILITRQLTIIIATCLFLFV